MEQGGSKSIPLKNYFGSELANRLQSLIQPHYNAFPAEEFITSISKQVDQLELKQRVALIAAELRTSLPQDYTEALGILMKILGPENKTEEGMFTNGYFLMPVAFFVEKYGLEHYEISMPALYEITKRHTSEYSIRPFLQIYPDHTLAILREWSKDENAHVRRLVSEGSRPRLPWAKRMRAIKEDPAINLSLLESLLADSSFYVRKSVANHIHDLIKDYQEETIAWLEKQMQSEEKHMSWIVRHSLRSLVKSGNETALELIGRF
ncbi:DNA alkylation repair protein [Bacillus horti]|uniref:3-methyladenine DNA glycosylase AlkC n=1 Tax=Caldalkalibacillus horti TaxID=77523 RepID=A0ABT9VXC1_9BACI|nr:DNA alkylation repair protein [Bacillus horti]MDQ0165636.1 3-methyladenine DNA glycosylase AlkC [Bacillus horti]